MSFVPEVRHLMPEVHVIRQQRPARNGVRSGDYPVVGTDRRRLIYIQTRDRREFKNRGYGRFP